MLTTRDCWKMAGLFLPYLDKPFDFARIDSTSAEVVQDFIENMTLGQMKGLFLAGEPGVGKTHIAHLVMGKTIDLGGARFKLRVRAISASKYMDLIGQEMSLQSMAGKGSSNAVEEWEEVHRLLNGIETCRWLLLDDLATEHSTDWSRNRITTLIRNRGNAGKPTVMTTNLDGDDFGAAYGERTLSYIHQVADVVNIAGEDQRRAER